MKKGAFQIARQLFKSEIWLRKPATWLKLWLYIFGHVNYQDDIPVKGFKRGEGFFNFQQELQKLGTSFSPDIIKKCLAFLRKKAMISTTRSTRGVYLKVLKFDDFQTLKNYSSTTTSTREALEKHQRSTREALEKHSVTIRSKELKKEINKEKLPFFENWLKYRKSIKKPITSEDTLKSLVKRFNAEPIEKIEWTVNNSIENGYQGLFWNSYKEIKPRNDFTVDHSKPAL